MPPTPPTSPTPQSTSTRPTFYLLDGHAQIYRAYFAPFRDLSAPDGSPVKAVYVFTQMLLGLVASQKPAYLAMAIDHGDETVFRKKIYPAYKSNRPSRPPDFTPQEQRILQICRDVRLPIFEAPGYEADDLLATFATRLDSLGFDVVLVSKDKDLRQILSDHIRMYDVSSDRFFTPADMLATLGYAPHQAVDIQTLMGDTVDNVPGIPGVGEKTAAKLINQFGSADAVIANADKLTPKLKEAALAHGDKLQLARQLVTLVKDVPIPFDPESCRFTGLHTPGLIPHLHALGFSSLLRKYDPPPASTPSTPASPSTPSAPPIKSKPAPPPPSSPPAPLFDAQGFTDSLFNSPPPPSAPESVPANDQELTTTDSPSQSTNLEPPTTDSSADCDYHLINTPEAFASFLAQLKSAPRFAFDTETDDLGALVSKPIGFSFSWQPKTGYYVAVAGPIGAPVLPLADVVSALKPILEDPSVQKIAHNAKYDITVYRRLGIHVRGLSMDTMIAAFILDSSRLSYGIDRLALDLLNFRKIPTEALIGKGKAQLSMKLIGLQEVARYASEDADISLRLADFFAPQLAAQPPLQKLHDELETPLVNVLTDMELTGITVDPAVLSTQSAAMALRIAELKDQILAAAGLPFNPDSPKQLADILFNHLKLPPQKKTKTGASTDVEVLDALADLHPVPKLILEYRSLQKLKGTYLDALGEQIHRDTGRIHAHFHQIGAATGRLSCSDPNLQNIPIRTDEGRRIRSAFVAPPGHLLLTADYSQIELRILAHYTREPALIRAFETDQDVHAAVASEVFGVPLDQVSRQQRSRAKVINFGIIYGITAQGLSRRIEGLSRKAADEFITSYKARFSAIDTFMDQCVQHARAHGYVTTLLGRRRHLPDVNSATFSRRTAAERMAINSVIQGSAADLIKLAMLNIHRRIQLESLPMKLLLQVHDELVFEVPEAHVPAMADLIRHEMTSAQISSAMHLTVPLKVETGYAPNWQEVK